MARTFDLTKLFVGLAFCVAASLAAGSGEKSLPPAAATLPGPGPEYVIGPLDNLNIFVWRNPELSETVPVRPDGRISVPLIEDLPAAGLTPTQLARDIEKQLKKYVQDPIVTVIVTGFTGPFDRQVRIVGEAAHPQAIPYRNNMTVLDAMIAVGGLTQYAAGNRATIVRTVDGKQTEYRVRLADLIKDGDVSANVAVLPGDILIIPQSWF
jgi:polysaccharide biosynthesis/export protein